MKKLIMLLAVVCVAFTAACAQAGGGPSDAIIKKAIEARLMAGLTPRLAGSILGSRTQSVESIEIVAKGKFNERGNYWPIKARVRGGCLSQGLMKAEKRIYDGIEDFQIMQDDYEKWYANYANPL